MGKSEITPELLLSLIKEDHSLSKEQKAMLEEKLNEPTFFNRLLYGAAGAGAMLIINKFLKLNPTTKVILTMAGFGLGQLLLKLSEDDKSKSFRYNKELGAYEFDPTK